MRSLTLEEVNILEIVTILASVIGILLSLLHGNLYDYFANLLTIPGFAYIRILYASLLVYSTLILIVFSSLRLLKVRNERIRLLNYIQGWLFVAMIVFAFEWLDSLMIWNATIVMQNKFVEYPFVFLSKGASVVFASSLFLFWLIEKKKKGSD
jgi:hypothetical protein